MQTGYSATLYTDFDQGDLYSQTVMQFSRCTSKCDCIYAHKQSTAGAALIFTKLAHATALCADRFNEFQLERKITVRSFD